MILATTALSQVRHPERRGDPRPSATTVERGRRYPGALSAAGIRYGTPAAAMAALERLSMRRTTGGGR
jgi:hypothetical protein